MGTVVEVVSNNHTSNNTSEGETISSKKAVEFREPKTILQGSNVNQKTTVSFADEIQKPNNVSDENAGRKPSNQSSQNSIKYLPLTSNAAVYREKTSKTEAVLPVKSKTSITSSSSSLPTSSLTPLQESMNTLLEASKEQQKSNQTYLANDLELLPATNSGLGFLQSQILPPLYHPEPAPQDPAFQQGPNIYALQNTNNNTQDHSMQHSLPNNMCDHRKNSYPTDYYHNSNTMVGNNSIDHTNCNTNNMDYHGRSHPLYCYDNHNTYNQYGANANTMQMQPNHSFVASDNIGATYDTGYSHSETVSYDHNQHPTFSGTAINNKLRKSVNRTTADSSYRTERIEKQRQMMAGGGSLFVTSPRSFLMGWKSDDMPR